MVLNKHSTFQYFKFPTSIAMKYVASYSRLDTLASKILLDIMQ